MKNLDLKLYYLGINYKFLFNYTRPWIYSLKYCFCFKKHTLHAELYIYEVLDIFWNPIIPCWQYFC